MTSGAARIEGPEARAGQVRALSDRDLEAAGLQHGDDRVPPAVNIVHLDYDLADERPMRRVDPGEDVGLGLLHVDLQKVDAGEPLLRDDRGEAAGNGSGSVP